MKKKKQRSILKIPTQSSIKKQSAQAGIDFGSVNVEALEIYDQALQMEEEISISPEQKKAQDRASPMLSSEATCSCFVNPRAPDQISHLHAVQSSQFQQQNGFLRPLNVYPQEFPFHYLR